MLMVCKCNCGECKASVISKLYQYIKKNKEVYVGEAINDGFHPNQSVNAFRKLLRLGLIKREYEIGKGGVKHLYSITR